MTMNPVDLTESKYHELADVWLESALVKFEDLQDEGADVDVEYSVCFFLSKGTGRKRTSREEVLRFST